MGVNSLLPLLGSQRLNLDSQGCASTCACWVILLDPQSNKHYLECVLLVQRKEPNEEKLPLGGDCLRRGHNSHTEHEGSLDFPDCIQIPLMLI